jgi:hypothetical protein
VRIGEIRTVTFSYTWCVKCNSVVSSTGPAGSADGKRIKDNEALTAVEEAISRVRDLGDMIAMLNKFWDSAVLPSALV